MKVHGLARRYRILASSRPPLAEWPITSTANRGVNGREAIQRELVGVEHEQRKALRDQLDQRTRFAPVDRRAVIADLQDGLVACTA
jgi:hypothetical protein